MYYCAGDKKPHSTSPSFHSSWPNICPSVSSFMCGTCTLATLGLSLPQSRSLRSFALSHMRKKGGWTAPTWSILTCRTTNHQSRTSNVHLSTALRLYPSFLTNIGTVNPSQPCTCQTALTSPSVELTTQIPSNSTFQKLSTSSYTAVSIWMTWSCSPRDMVIIMSGTRPLFLNSANSNWVWQMQKSRPRLSSLSRILDMSLFGRLGRLRVTPMLSCMRSWQECMKSGCRNSPQLPWQHFKHTYWAFRLLFVHDWPLTSHLICHQTHLHHNTWHFLNFCTNSLQMALNITMA